MIDIKQDLADWWRTDITSIQPGKITFRKEPVEEAIVSKSFAQMIWHMVIGTPLEGSQEKLFEAALVAAVDHGPQAPSIAAARMAATCGVGLNNAMATGLNMLGDIHGGAGEQALEMFTQAQAAQDFKAFVRAYQDQQDIFLPGFGHRFHKEHDPRVSALCNLVKAAVTRNVVEGTFLKTAHGIETALSTLKGHKIPLNIDGITAVIYGEIGVPAPLARGFFCLSRSVGILAHAWEQSQQGGRNKGPYPPNLA